MTKENKIKLLRAYEAALGTEVTPDEIAELLMDVILGEMGSADDAKPNVFRGGVYTTSAVLPPNNKPVYPTCETTWTNEDSLGRGTTMGKADE